ncbi:MAG: flagellar hook-basal body protein [Planctomycetes bacterium]|nr:flagellar hook-basal body protein [Planctomycetota bacterium]
MDHAELALSTCLNELGKQQAAIANNLANINSSGFKRRAGGFSKFELALDEARRGGINTTTIPQYAESSDFSQGDFARTDVPYDLSLIGKGFLRVRDGSGTEYYTRNGALALGADGTLMTRSGHAVLDERGDSIRLNEIREIKITAQGTILDEATGETRGRIGVFDVGDPRRMMPKGSGLFSLPANTPEPEVDSTTEVRQGGLERSNVNSVSELVAMISVSRLHGAVSKALTTVESIHDQLLGLARS